MNTPLNIASLSAEVAPFSKAGGLGDVARSLPRALHKLGHRVVIITPRYAFIDPREYKLTIVIDQLPVKIDQNTTIRVRVWSTELRPGLPIYFLDHQRIFSKNKRVYGTANDNLRFYFFSVAALKLLQELRIQPDIIQCHDWHTALVPEILKKRPYKWFENSATVYTIHNLNYQFGMWWWEVPKSKRDSGTSSLPSSTSKTWQYINFAKRGIIHTDIINTVSEQYAEEILTHELGEDLNRMLAHRKDRLFGIVNGIDYNDYNPATDPGLFFHYDVDSLHIKTQNKLALQRMFDLPENQKIPLLGIVSRLSEQKGLDLLMDIFEPLMRMSLQLVIMGAGEKKYEAFFRKLIRKYPKKVAAHLKFNQDDATKVYAGSDMFLMPSRFEPCGLGQLISLRYGSIPIVRAVGGLASTITDYNLRIKKGNGFVFKSYDSRDMLVAIARATEVHKDREAWIQLIKDGMRQSFSWKIPAKKYVQLFERARLRHQTHNI